MTIINATIEHLSEIALLFDGYRKFYMQDSNIDGAKAFIKARIIKQDSIIYIAYKKNEAIGFTQLYPLYSSVSMEPMYLLNDLFVKNNYRGQGIGEALINEAKKLCEIENLKGLAIQTAFDNPAQQLYDRLGFVKDTDLHFFWSNNCNPS